MVFIARLGRDTGARRLLGRRAGRRRPRGRRRGVVDAQEAGRLARRRRSRAQPRVCGAGDTLRANAALRAAATVPVLVSALISVLVVLPASRRAFAAA